MRILLVVPPADREKEYGKLKDSRPQYPSLGLSYIGAVGRHQDHEVRVVDCDAEELSFTDVDGAVRDFKPDLLGMQTFCTTIRRCHSIAERAKKIDPSMQVVLGGVQATLFPEDSLNLGAVDYVVLGEGEMIFSRLLDALQREGEGLEDIHGLAWKKEGRVIINRGASLIGNLDDIPLPALDLFPMQKYNSAAQLRGDRTVHMMTSRGCPNQCINCCTPKLFGRSYRFNSSERVIQEIKRLKDRFQVDGIQFYDDVFTLHRKRTMALLDALIDEKLGISWTCFTRVDLVDPELLMKMREAGCYQIFYGIESGTQRLLNLISKGIKLEQARQAVKDTKKAGIEIVASFMLALPTETREDTLKTIQFALELNPDYVYWLTATPYPGTRLFEVAKTTGILLDIDWSNFSVFNEIVYVPEGRSVEEIRSLIKYAYRKFYLRPGYALRRLNNLRKLPPKKVFNLVRSGIKTLMG